MRISLRKLTAGDKRAWDAFVDRFSGVIYSAVRNAIAARRPDVNEEDVRDLVQGVFIRLVKEEYRLLKSYDPSRASLVTWLTIVARSAAIDFLRRRSLPTVPLDERALQLKDEKARLPALPLKMHAGLLPPRQRLILHLIFDRGLSTSEIARTLGVREQTVRSLNHKAMKKLRRFFNKGI